MDNIETLTIGGQATMNNIRRGTGGRGSPLWEEALQRLSQEEQATAMLTSYQHHMLGMTEDEARESDAGRLLLSAHLEYDQSVEEVDRRGTDMRSDEQLLASCDAGDQQACEELARRRLLDSLRREGASGQVNEYNNKIIISLIILFIITFIFIMITLTIIGLIVTYMQN